MLLTIVTEYEEIHLISKKPIDLKLIENIQTDLISELLDWEKARQDYLSIHNLNPDDIKYMTENILYNKDRDNPFYTKKLNELMKKQSQINEYRTLNPRPDFVVLEK